MCDSNGKQTVYRMPNEDHDTAKWNEKEVET